MTMPTQHVESTDGTRIAYERVGTGPNLLFVWGALGTKDISFARPYVDAFKGDFTVVNYDRRGRGESTDSQPYTVEREVEDIGALVKAVGPSHVLGISSGAALALEAAARGVPMLSVTAFEPPYAVGEHMRPELVAYEPRVKALIAEGRRDDALRLFMRIVGMPALMVAAFRLFPIWKKLRPTAHTLPYDAAIMNGFEPPVERLATIRVPSLLAYGEKSPKMLQDGTRFVAQKVPGSQLRSLPKQSHNLKPAAILPVVKEFVAAHRARALVTARDKA